MLTDQTYYRSTAVAQALLSKAGSIEVDGKWGRFTQDAFEKAPIAVRNEVIKVLSNLSPPTTPDALRTYRDTQRPKQPVKAVAPPTDLTAIRAMIATLANQEGVPPDLALKVAKLESDFKPYAVSPTGAKGLFQLTSIALKDVKAQAGFAPTDVMDPVQNTLAGLKYLKIVARYLGRPLTDFAEIYMGYNIGATGAKNVLAGKPELAAAQIKHQAYGPPAVYAVNVREKVAAA